MFNFAILISTPKKLVQCFEWRQLMCESNCATVQTSLSSAAKVIRKLDRCESCTVAEAHRTQGAQWQQFKKSCFRNMDFPRRLQARSSRMIKTILVCFARAGKSFVEWEIEPGDIDAVTWSSLFLPTLLCLLTWCAQMWAETNMGCISVLSLLP